MNPIVNIGIKAARSAGNSLQRCLLKLDRLNVEIKGQNDFVSDADYMAEEDIIDTIQKHYPDHGIISEERGAVEPENKTQEDVEYEWIIDPLDGTINFLHNHPDFVISIGVRRKGVMEHAIIFDPLRNDMFTATRNQGAQLNEKKIRVSDARKLRKSIITMGHPHKNQSVTDSWFNSFSNVASLAAGIRMSGSSALDLAHVACGRTDAFWQPSLSIWDIAAGSLLVREARGLVADFEGQQNFLENGNIIAAGPRIFSDLLNLVGMDDNKISGLTR